MLLVWYDPHRLPAADAATFNIVKARVYGSGLAQ
jgi:hypothetical protein